MDMILFPVSFSSVCGALPNQSSATPQSLRALALMHLSRDPVGAVDAESPLSTSELQVLRDQYNDENSKGWCSVQTKFNLGWGCVKSSNKAEISEGVSLFMGKSLVSTLRTEVVEGEVDERWRSVLIRDDISLWIDIYRTDPPRRRECLYFLAVGHYKLGSFAEAKRYNGPSSFPFPLHVLPASRLPLSYCLPCHTYLVL